MASWRERLGWWREFRRLGVRDVRRRVDGVAWHAAKMREAERFLWWHSNGLTILTAVIVGLGVVVGFLNYLK
jgi:hypothetical protein